MIPSWFEHMDLMNSIIAGLVLAIIWFMIRTLKKIDENQTNLFNRVGVVERDLYELRGEHSAIKGRCK
jgi:hypothetical protein